MSKFLVGTKLGIKRSSNASLVRVGGLAFRPRTKHGVLVYAGFHKWHNAGRPAGLVYATIADLTNAGVPIIDAIFVEGIFVRCDRTVAATDDLEPILVPSYLGFPMSVIPPTVAEAGIKVAAKSKKMSYRA